MKRFKPGDLTQVRYAGDTDFVKFVDGRWKVDGLEWLRCEPYDACFIVQTGVTLEGTPDRDGNDKWLEDAIICLVGNKLCWFFKNELLQEDEWM